MTSLTGTQIKNASEVMKRLKEDSSALDSINQKCSEISRKTHAELQKIHDDVVSMLTPIFKYQNKLDKINRKMESEEYKLLEDVKSKYMQAITNVFLVTFAIQDAKENESKKI